MTLPDRTLRRRSAGGVGWAMLGAALLLLCFPVSEASAQQIVGTVIDRVTQLPVPNASVLILEPDSSLRHSLLTDEQGRFATPSTTGRFLLRAAGLGYAPVWSQVLELRRTDNADFMVQLPPRPLELAGVQNFADDAWFRAVGRRLDPNGFWKRMQVEPGRFLSPEQIDRRKPNQIADLMISMPGVRLDPESHGTALFGRRGCAPTVYLNGFRIPRDVVRGVDGMYLEQLVRPQEIRGVEVYSDPEFSPAPFIGAPRCAVVVLWTNVGVEIAVAEAP